MILSAQTIRRRCNTLFFPSPMVQPFHERKTEFGLTFGLSACGYDVRIAQTLWLWPLWGRLASTMEYFDIPVDIKAGVHDKSTWARRFVFVQNTIAEPGWCGYLTLELTRYLPWPVRIKKGTPIAQIIFEKLDHPTDMPYRGKYQNQEAGPQPARLVDKI